MAPDRLAELRDRQIAFLYERLVSPAAQAEWRANLDAAFGAVLDAPLGHVVDRGAASRLVDAALADGALRKGLEPLLSAAIDEALRQARNDGAPAGRFVPQSARRKLDELAALPGLLPETFVRAVVETDAVEEILREVLQRALTEFSEKANPFTAEWGLPSLLKRLGPFGLGAMGKSLDGMRAEFERRIEPEIRRFLQGFSRRSLRTVSDVTVAKLDGPAFVALRRRLAAELLARPVRELAALAESDSGALTRAIALESLVHAAGLEETRERVRALVLRAIEARAERPLRDVLGELAITAPLDTAALADATWPIVRHVLASEPLRLWIARLVTEFFDGVAGPSEA